MLCALQTCGRNGRNRNAKTAVPARTRATTGASKGIRLQRAMRKTGRGATCHVTARLAVMASLEAIVVTVGGGGLGLEVRGQGALDTSHCGRFIESAGGGRQLCRRRSEAVSRGSRSVEEERRGGGWEEGEAGRGGGTGGQRSCRRRESDETGSGETRQARELLEAGQPGLAAVVGGAEGGARGGIGGADTPAR